ncbi:MAG: superoxide dismutase family protein [Chloroflexi bacterium]|nr:superoxide dismutase family protein [Chloroflexota bacterium]
MRRILVWGALIGFCLAAWAGSAAAQTASATAELKNAAGQVVGTATLVQASGGVRVTASVKGLQAGKHGIHIHAVGKCEGPDFTTAGGHFNPDGKQHGAQNPAGAHAGDLPNLTVAVDGSGAYDATAAKATLASGAPNSLFDADGSALVIHLSEDDEKTDPTGNSGARIACGVIALSVLPQSGADGTLPAPLWLAAIVGACAALGAAWRLRRA